MKIARRKEGFTLVELLVVILCAALITAAATTFLLLGLRINHSSTETVRQQNEIRIMSTLLENMVGEGTVRYYAESEEDDPSWTLYTESKTAVLAYMDEDGTIRTANDTEDGNILIDEIKSRLVVDGNLLNFEFTVDDSTYTMSIYCRTSIEPLTPETQIAAYSNRNTNAEDQADVSKITANNNVNEEKTSITSLEYHKRALLITVLKEQIGSTGQIAGTEQYYSQWYNASWPKSTPWCACFLSWAAEQDRVGLDRKAIPRFAAVTDGVEGFQGEITSNSHTSWSGSWERVADYSPLPGDFIFFNIDQDPEADHVGAVYYVEGDTVYTIEGNYNGTVAICSYSLNDARIYGYGILDWTNK